MTKLSSGIRELIAEATRADGTPPVSDQALMAVAQGKRELFEFQGDAIGIIGEGELDLVVRPSSRGAGLGRRALTHLLNAWRESESSDELRAWAHGENPAATALLRGAGFVPARTLLRMSLDPAQLDAAIAEARSMPDGFTVLAFGQTQPGQTQPDQAQPDQAQSDQADDWVRVNAAAFANHPEQGAMTRADFDALTAEPWFDAADLRLAYTSASEGAPSGAPAGAPGAPGAPGELAAFAWVKTTREQGTTETELYALGVAPEYAGRGLGAAMLGETLRRMATHEPDRITLYVEGDNAEALPLYERAGFAVEQRSTQWVVACERIANE